MFKKTKPSGHTEVIEGVHLKTLVYGDRTLMVEVKFEKGAVIPSHGHPHEQTGYLISGQLDFVIDGENIIAKPGDSWNISGDVEHSATAIDETVVIEVFSPVREDYVPYYTTEEDN
jgi:quercetin dioxygenase-like cupin family protein